MKNKFFWTLVLLIVTSFSLAACQFPFIHIIQGSGNIITETRTVSGFNQIQLNGAGRLVILQGASESLEIVADDNILDELISELAGNELTLGFQEKPWRKTIIPSQTIVYNLTVTDLEKITFNGAGNLELSELETNALEIVVNGASQISIEALTAQKLNFKIAGTSSITIDGNVSSQFVQIDGTGNYQAGALQTSASSIEINGMGNITVWASETLDITINGAGTVNYYGTPLITQDINGLGDISNKGNK